MGICFSCMYNVVVKCDYILQQMQTLSYSSLSIYLLFSLQHYPLPFHPLTTNDFTSSYYRTIRLTQCCTQFKSPGDKILCVLYLHYNVAFTFMIWKFLKQNVLFPRGLNWVQHWVSRIGLLLTDISLRIDPSIRLIFEWLSLIFISTPQPKKANHVVS